MVFATPARGRRGDFGWWLQRRELPAPTKALEAPPGDLFGEPRRAWYARRADAAHGESVHLERRSARGAMLGSDDLMQPVVEPDGDARSGAEPLMTMARAPGWIRRRARNVYRRPMLVGTVTAAVFVITLLSLVLVPLQEQRAVRAALPRQRPRPDTVDIQRHLTGAVEAARAADTALALVRAALAVSAGVASDSGLATEPGWDSLSAEIAELTRLLGRARSAPLPASYRALGGAAGLRGQPRVVKLLDTLSRIETSRAAFGASGGVDPIFVALTSRATQVGRELQRIAVTRRAALERELARSTPAVLRPTAADTFGLVRTRDSASAALASAHRWLAQARRIDSAMDDAGARARAVASIGASVPAMVAGACVFALVVGFGVSLLMEFGAPRVADREEAESLAGATVLATIGDEPDALERRRQVDAEMPPLVDLTSDAYRLLFGQLADRGDNLPSLTVVGDDALVAAVVAANLGAVVARGARTVLLIDTDIEGQSLSAVTRVRSTPGLVDVLTGGVDWSAVVRGVVVGRDRTMDVLPSGAFGARGVLDAAAPEFASLLEHVRRRYECVLVSAPLSRAGELSAAVNGAGGVILTVRVARTHHEVIGPLAGLIRGRGLSLRGLVLWERGDPSLVSA